MSTEPEPLDTTPAVRETHISIVFLVGDHAAKLKKPVRFPFVDLSTREARERICHREVELNRRIAPDVYLGVFDVMGPDGTPRDHLVVMRRMPDDRRLARMVERARVPAGAMRDLAHVIAAFHGRAETSDVISAAGRDTAILRRWRDGFREIAPLLRSERERTVEAEIEARAERYVHGRAAIFDARIAQGRIRDGHGDLLADDVFLIDDGPRVLDCLEFDDELRFGDVLADVAFLAMDLERLGADDLARQLLEHHRELVDDTYPRTLLHHYVAMRAHIRAKVAALKAAPGDIDASDRTRRLLDLTLDHLRQTRVVLVLVGGEPGTGKSTLAAGVADSLGWAVLRSDEIRKELAGVEPLDHSHTELDAGLYGGTATTATYEALLHRARLLLELGEPVVLDASWGDADFRSAARRLADATAADLVEVRCVVDPETAARRIADRQHRGTDVSDASPEVSRVLRARFAPWPSAAPIDTAGPARHSLDRALDAVRTGDLIPRTGSAGGVGT